MQGGRVPIRYGAVWCSSIEARSRVQNESPGHRIPRRKTPLAFAVLPGRPCSFFFLFLFLFLFLLASLFSSVLLSCWRCCSSLLLRSRSSLLSFFFAFCNSDSKTLNNQHAPTAATTNKTPRKLPHHFGRQTMPNCFLLHVQGFSYASVLYASVHSSVPIFSPPLLNPHMFMRSRSLAAPTVEVGLADFLRTSPLAGALL